MSLSNWLKYQIGTRWSLRGVQRVRELVEYRRGKSKGSFSQHREDEFFVDFFRGTTGTFIDIGAGHPFIINNTFLLYQRGWRGVNVEPNRYLYRRFQRLRPKDINLNVGAGRRDTKGLFYHLWPSVSSTFSPTACLEMLEQGSRLLSVYPLEIRTLRSLCRLLPGGRAPDLVSIDTEGYELEVLAGADWAAFRPRMLVIENAGHGDTDLDTVRDYLTSRGYRLLRRIGCNDVFVPEPT